MHEKKSLKGVTRFLIKDFFENNLGFFEHQGLENDIKELSLSIQKYSITLSYNQFLKKKKHFLVTKKLITTLFFKFMYMQLLLFSMHNEAKVNIYDHS